MGEDDRTRESLLEELSLLRRELLELKEVRRERVEAEDALRHVGEVLYRLFHGSRFPMLLHQLGEGGTPGPFIGANEAACRRLGYTRDELLGMTPMDIGASVCLDDVPRIMRELTGQAQTTFETTYVSSAGLEIPVEVTCHVLTWRGTRVVLTLAQDISRRKQQEQALQAAMEELRRRNAETSALLESCRAALGHREFKPAMRSIFDSCRGLIGALSGCVTLLGEDETQSLVLLLTPGGSPWVLDPFLPLHLRGLREEACRTGRALWRNDLTPAGPGAIPQEGSTGLQSVLFAPLVVEGRTAALLALADKAGGFTEDDARVTSMFAEIAAVALRNSRTLELLESSEKRFRSVVETAGDAIVGCDARGRIVFWNRGAEALTGYSTEEVLGKPIDLVVPRRFADRHQRGMRRALGNPASAVMKSTEAAWLRKDGSEVPVELSVAAWKVGRSTFFTAVARDLTERQGPAEQLL